MNTRRALLFGAVAVALYLVAAVATAAVSGRRVLALFEGIGPPPPYQWVNPPSAFAAGNNKPKPATVDIALSAVKSVEAAGVTADGQVSVNFSVGAFALHDADTNVHGAITPLDPATLGPVPPGLATDGNAYRIQLTYQPSGTPVDSLAVPGNVFLTEPTPGGVLLYSPDGRTWSKLATQTVGATSTVGATFTRPGWYLVAASPTAVASAGHTNRLGIAIIAALVAGLAILFAATPVAFRAARRRAQRAAGKAPGPEPSATRPPRPNRRR